MRTKFIDTLIRIAKDDDSVFLLTADLGFGLFDQYRYSNPNRFIDIGVAEANMIGVAAGFIHLVVVHNVGIIHGGLNLYNNGFAGGLVATAIVAIYRGLGRDV